VANEAFDFIELDTWDFDYGDTDAQKWLVTGPVLGRAINEFSAGLKIGRATYDEREHAFWLVLDDFSGGIGYRRLDIRTQLGTIWDNPTGADVRFSGRVVLPPLISTLGADGIGAYDYSTIGPGSNHNACVSALGGGEGLLYVGIGDTLYSTDKTRAALTAEDVLANSTRINSVFPFFDGTTRYLYYCGTAGTGNSVLRRATVPFGGGSDWDDASAKCIEDAIVYDKGWGVSVIVGSTPIGKIIYSADGVNWSDDLAPVPEILFNAGEAAVSFIGVAPAPWGGSGIYFLNAGKFYCLDFDTRTAYPIDLGDNIRLVCGALYQDTVVVTDGWNVYQYNPTGVETVRNLGVSTKDGLASCIATGRITAMASDGDQLFAVWSLKDAGSTQLMVYTGTGWTTLGDNISSFTAFTCCIEALPYLFAEVQSRRLWIIGAESYSGTTGAGARLYSMPAHGKGPIIGTDTFSSMAGYTTGWIDGGFADLDGILMRMEVDGYYLTTDQHIDVSYRLDNDETAGWTTLGTFYVTGDRLWFDTDQIGLPFRTVQFAVNLHSVYDTTKSPDLRALVLVYDKKPDLRMAWTVRIDVDRMVNEGIEVAGVPATMERVWDKLRKLYSKIQLLYFRIPQAEDPEIRVRMVDIPGTFDDFRDEVGGGGTIDVQLIEVVARDWSGGD
jgi:hypothetical protein